ncbi:MAG: YcxB family protein [Cystobacterineae bacterium]|nr:YcxB family protein [Cystobacterineae bacterium]
MNPVILEFDNRLAEHLAADRLYYRSTFWSKVDKGVAILLLLFGVLLISLIGLSWWTVACFPLALLEWFNLLSFRTLQIRFFFKRNPKFLEKYHLSFSDSGIHFKTSSLESKLAWSHYTHVLENKRILLLIYGPRMYTVIPTRVFSSAEQHEQFLSLVRKHVPGSLSTTA